MKELGSGKCPMGHHSNDSNDESALIDTLPFPVALLNSEGIIKAVNSNMSQLLGFSPSELKEADYLKILHDEAEVRTTFDATANTLNRPPHTFQANDFWRWILSSGQVFEQEWTYVSKEGRHIIAKGRFAPMADTGNIIVSFFDVSSYKNLIAELGDSDLKTRMIFETAVDGFVTIDEIGTIQSFNKAAEKLFGYTADEVIGENVKILTPPEISVQHDQYLKNYKETRNAKIIGKGRDVFGKRKDDSQFPMNLSVGEGKLSGGKVMYTGIIRDMTEYRKSEESIRATNEKLDRQNRIKTDIASVAEATLGTNDIVELSSSAITKLAEISGSCCGTFYVRDDSLPNDKQMFKLMGTFAYTKRKSIETSVCAGEGILGQAILEKKTIILTNVPDSHIDVSTSLGASAPNNLIIVPIIFERTLLGLFELASFNEYTKENSEFLEETAIALAPNVQSALGHQRTKALLDDSNRLAEELKVQQDTLKNTNDELSVQQEELKNRNIELNAQQEELKRSNETLAAKEEELRSSNERLKEREEELRKTMEAQKSLTASLQEQKNEIERTNSALESKAGQLEQTSAFKSQFLANMSHELRTPLNSLMILSKLLGENRDENLTAKQVEHAKLIHNSGAELLGLINDILDLAKVESGEMTVSKDTVSFADTSSYINSTFSSYAETKNIEFFVELEDTLPPEFSTDETKFKQILKNLLSNAFKFTDKGHVRFSIKREDLSTIAFAVSDTGIGIPSDKINDVFEAFRQVDGSIQRKFGGTGLGMTISSEYAKLLGGSITLTSVEGKGSTFTLLLPLEKSSTTLIPQKTCPRHSIKSDITIENKYEADTSVDASIQIYCEDSKDDITEGDKVALIIEDDIAFAKIMTDIAVKHGYKTVHTALGASAVSLAEKYHPTVIILDLSLPDCHGYTILDRLKLNKNTRHIPVNVISVDPHKSESLSKGAVRVLQKPIAEEELELLMQKTNSDDDGTTSILLIEDNELQVESIRALPVFDGVTIESATTAPQAIAMVGEKKYRCIILDLGLPGSTGKNLLDEKSFKESVGETPVIIYTGRDLDRSEIRELEMFSKRIILKNANSAERLQEEVSIFLQEASDFSEDVFLESASEKNLSLEGKKILLVDDDVRNIFAVTNYLEVFGMDIIYAENGQEALDILEAESQNFDIVLMDIMMPGMDGNTAIKLIRENEKLKDIPVIALTAKAMKGDRDECLRIGASDYISKPVDMDKLVSLMKVWITRQTHA